jgi:hypothetical protein
VHGHAITEGFQIEDDSVPLIFKEIGTSGPGSYWRMALDENHLRFDSADNVGLSGYTKVLDLKPTGEVEVIDLTVTGTCNGCGGGLTQSSCDWYMVGSGRAYVWGWHEKICPNGQYIAGIRWYKQGERVDDEAIQIYCCSA